MSKERPNSSAERFIVEAEEILSKHYLLPTQNADMTGKPLGKFIRASRECEAISIMDLSERTRISETKLLAYERGCLLKSDMNSEELANIANELGVEVATLELLLHANEDFEESQPTLLQRYTKKFKKPLLQMLVMLTISIVITLAALRLVVPTIVEQATSSMGAQIKDVQISVSLKETDNEPAGEIGDNITLSFPEDISNESKTIEEDVQIINMNGKLYTDEETAHLFLHGQWIVNESPIASLPGEIPTSLGTVVETGSVPIDEQGVIVTPMPLDTPTAVGENDIEGNGTDLSTAQPSGLEVPIGIESGVMLNSTQSVPQQEGMGDWAQDILFFSRQNIEKIFQSIGPPIADPQSYSLPSPTDTTYAIRTVSASSEFPELRYTIQSGTNCWCIAEHAYRNGALSQIIGLYNFGESGCEKRTLTVGEAIAIPLPQDLNTLPETELESVPKNLMESFKETSYIYVMNNLQTQIRGESFSCLKSDWSKAADSAIDNANVSVSEKWQLWGGYPVRVTFSNHLGNDQSIKLMVTEQ